MVFTPVLIGETLFFVIMTVLFEYHWRNHDFDGRALLAIRLWYYLISIICFIGMLLAAASIL